MLIKSILAFLLGGFFCLIAQILIDKTRLSPARILVSFVVFGVFIGAVGIYEPIFDAAGCGISLPLIGFGANVALGVREAVLRDGIYGAVGGAFSAAAIGCTVSLILGLLSSIFFKGKPKRM